MVATLEFGLMVLVRGRLSFLGLGIQPPTPSWGAILAVGRNYIASAWWIATLPGLCLFLLVLTVNLLGDQLRDRLDPQRRPCDDGDGRVPPVRRRVRVVVTGAGGIFGRRIAAAFARAGARSACPIRAPTCWIGSRPSWACAPEATLRHATELREDGLDPRAGPARRAARGSAPDILINNAGVYPRGQLLDVPVDEWDRIMDVNLRAPFLLTREMARLMIAAGVRGSVVNITSGAAQRCGRARCRTARRRRRSSD